MTKLLQEIIDYAGFMNVDEDVYDWIDTHLKPQLDKNKTDQGEIEHIIDYLASDKRPKRLNKMSYEQAKSNTDKWNKSLIKKGSKIIELESDIEVIKDFGDGFKIVKLIGKNAYEREGFLMRHCLSSYWGLDKEIYSLRDKDNMPHCTMEKDQQIKGKGNGAISPKYIDYIVSFLEDTGMEVGDREMKNLGYVNVKNIKEKLHKVKNSFYRDNYLLKDSVFFDLEGKEYLELDILDYKDLIIETKEGLKINFDLEAISKNQIKILKLGKNASSGDNTNNASSGDFTKNASSGYYTKNASSGNHTQNASSGDNTQNASSGDFTQNASSGYYTKDEIKGLNSVSVSCGRNSIVKATIGTPIALTYYKLNHNTNEFYPYEVKAGKIGEKGLKANTWYGLDKEGNFIEVKND